MSEARKARRGQRRGDGSGGRGVTGGVGDFGFWVPSPSLDVTDVGLDCDSVSEQLKNPSVMRTVSIVSLEVDNTWRLMLAMAASYSSSASVAGTIWLAGVGSPLTPRPCLSKESNSGTLDRMASR